RAGGPMVQQSPLGGPPSLSWQLRAKWIWPNSLRTGSRSIRPTPHIKPWMHARFGDAGSSPSILICSNSQPVDTAAKPSPVWPWSSTLSTMDWEELHTNLPSLMTFLTVARLGRFTAAADSLGINHATVSRRINGLEKVTGQRLLLRSQSGWEITAEGRQVFEIAEEI